MLVASSGQPFNVTTGVDSNGDSIFNDRPTYADFQTFLANAKANPATPFPGNVGFHCQPEAGAAEIPVNCAEGPAHFTLNLRLTKTIGFGKKTQTATNAGGMGGGTFGRGPGGGDRGGRGGGGMFGGDNSGQRYSLTFGISARNLFNTVNEGTPIGITSSSLFGRANGLQSGAVGSQASNRRVDLQMTFSF